MVKGKTHCMRLDLITRGVRWFFARRKRNAIVIVVLLLIFQNISGLTF